MTTTPAPTYRSILRSRNIRLLFAAQSISFLGTWISLIALNVKAYNLTQSSLGVSAIFLLTALPSLVFGLIGSVYVDRFDRKKLLIATDIARLLLTILIMLADNILLLYLLTFLCATAGMIYRMARLAIVPQLAAGKEELLTINALLNLTQTLTLTLGPAVGGLIIAYLGVGSAFALDAATFALSAVLIARMTVPGLSAGRLASGRALRHLQEGFRFVSANRPVRDHYRDDERDDARHRRDQCARDCVRANRAACRRYRVWAAGFSVGTGLAAWDACDWPGSGIGMSWGVCLSWQWGCWVSC